MDMGMEKIQDNHGYFPCKWGKNRFFSRELPEKSARVHTNFIYAIESSLCGETLCKRREIIEIRFLR
jgi:hypothetical protein